MERPCPILVSDQRASDAIPNMHGCPSRSTSTCCIPQNCIAIGQIVEQQILHPAASTHGYHSLKTSYSSVAQHGTAMCQAASAASLKTALRWVAPILLVQQQAIHPAARTHGYHSLNTSSSSIAPRGIAMCQTVSAASLSTALRWFAPVLIVEPQIPTSSCEHAWTPLSKHHLLHHRSA